VTDRRFVRGLLIVVLVLGVAVTAVLAGPSVVNRAAALAPYTIVASAGSGGSISPSGDVVILTEATDQAFTITADTGYHVADVLVDGVSIGPVPSYTFAAVAANHTISASFAINTYTITPTPGANGSISPAGAQTVAYGSTPTFTMTPALGYHVADVLVDGVSIGPVPSYTFAAVAANHTISASFAINTYTITPTAGANGSISPAVPQTVDYGASQTFSFTAVRGYYIADVLVDGVSIGPVPSYTFTAVAADHIISVSFAVGVQTRFSIGLKESVVDHGGSTLLTGVLYDSGDPLHEAGMGDRPVTVQSAPSAAGPWTNLQTLTTSSVAGSVGTCSMTVRPTASTYYRLRFVAGEGSGYGSSLSNLVRLGVRPVLGTPKAPAAVRAGRSFTVYGALSPRFPAGQQSVQIKVYRLKNRHWVSAGLVSATNANSGRTTRYSAKVKLTTKGKYRFRAYTIPTATWAGDTTRLSTTLTVR
jgi:hypothetical protein